jgi:hypothetical protein
VVLDDTVGLFGALAAVTGITMRDVSTVALLNGVYVTSNGTWHEVAKVVSTSLIDMTVMLNCENALAGSRVQLVDGNVIFGEGVSTDTPGVSSMPCDIEDESFKEAEIGKLPDIFTVLLDVGVTPNGATSGGI